jgi:hypothetical protein
MSLLALIKPLITSGRMDSIMEIMRSSVEPLLADRNVLIDLINLAGVNGKFLDLISAQTISDPAEYVVPIFSERTQELQCVVRKDVQRSIDQILSIAHDICYISNAEDRIFASRCVQAINRLDEFLASKPHFDSAYDTLESHINGTTPGVLESFGLICTDEEMSNVPLLGPTHESYEYTSFAKSRDSSEGSAEEQQQLQGFQMFKAWILSICCRSNDNVQAPVLVIGDNADDEDSD